MRGVNPADPATDQVRFGDWLASHGQAERTRRALWDLFSVASLNVPGDDASLALAAKVVQTGLLGDAGAADIGVPALSAGRAARARRPPRKLADARRDLRLNTKVTPWRRAVDGTGEGPGSRCGWAAARAGRGHPRPTPWCSPCRTRPPPG